MPNESWADKLADLRGIKACLGYLERELLEKDLKTAANIVGAAECAIEQEIVALLTRHDPPRPDAPVLRLISRPDKEMGEYARTGSQRNRSSRS